MQQPLPHSEDEAITTPEIDAAGKEHQQAVDGFFAAQKTDVEKLAGRIAETLSTGGKILACGNGGSACDAMHFAGELVGRFVNDRKALAAIALSADSGIISAIGNDYGYEQVFARQVEALGKPGDMLIAISTSGSSPNILAALEAAQAQHLHTVLLTGEKGRARASSADMCLVVPSTVTARIQEVHIFILQMLIARVEARMGL